MTAPPGQPPATLAPADLGGSDWNDPDEFADSAFNGAGIVSSFDDLEKTDWNDPFEVVFNSAAVGLDTLGFVADPFSSLVSAGIGWLIEHISFLHEGLDALLGDPLQIQAAATAWHAVAVELTAVAGELRGHGAPPSGPAASPGGWDGAAAGAYGMTAGDRAARIDYLAARSDELAITLITQGAAIGTLRSLVRDLIADKLTEFIGWLVGGAIGAFFTAGLSLAATVSWVVFDAISLANRIATAIGRLLERLGVAAHSLSGLTIRSQDAARIAGNAATAADRLHGRAKAADDLLGESFADDFLVESGKQFSNTDVANLEN